MKHNLLLKSFFVLMLIIGLSSYANASEVIGTLSSSSTGNENSTSGSISGTVSSPPSENNNDDGGSSSSSGSRARSVGTVLGASTSSTNPVVATNYFSADGTAFIPPSRGLAISPGTDDTTVAFDESVLGAEVAEAASPTQVATVSLSGLSAMNWFWIILLILLLVAFIIYLYNREEKNKRGVY
jgi:hypothetical protein